MKTLLLLYMGKRSITIGAGTEHVLSNMANEFVQRGYNVIIATNDYADSMPFFALDNRVQLIKLGLRFSKIPFHIKIKREVNRLVHYSANPFELWRANYSAQKLKKHLIGKSIDCVVGYTQESVWVAHGLGLNHVPVVAMMHNSITSLLGDADKAMLKQHERATVIQVLMPSYVNQAKRYIHHGHIICIPNAVDFVDLSERADLKKEKPMYTIMTIGRLDPVQKRTHILIDAFSILAEKYPGWKVKIYGDPDGDIIYRDQLIQKIADVHLETRILLCGTTNNIHDELSHADIFAFPSAYEGFPLALTEAMATGLPPVGFCSADAVNELIVNGENGLLCEDGTVAFAKGLEMLMKDQGLRVSMGAKAAKSMEIYQPCYIWDKWDRLFHEIMHF